MHTGTQGRPRANSLSALLWNCDTRPSFEPASAVAVLSCRVRRAYGAAACSGALERNHLLPGGCTDAVFEVPGTWFEQGSPLERRVWWECKVLQYDEAHQDGGKGRRYEACGSKWSTARTTDARRPTTPRACGSTGRSKSRRVQEAVRRGGEAAAGPAPAPLPHLRRDADAQELRAPGAARGPRRDVPATVERGREAQAEAAQGPKAAGVGREDAHRRGHGPGARRRRASPLSPA